jgi:hypothetical protein
MMCVLAKLNRLAALLDVIDATTGASHPAEPHLEEAAALVVDVLSALTDDVAPPSVVYLAARHHAREGA